MNVLIYTTKTCIYCDLAKKILDEKKIKYKEINIENDLNVFKNLIQKTNHKTVPQIFINDNFIGGYTNLLDFLNKENI